MHDLYRHLGNRSVWEAYEVTKCPVVVVTEVWVREGCASSLIETKTIYSADIGSWLGEPCHRCLPTGTYTRAMRLVWVGEERDRRRKSPSSCTLEHLASVWGLTDALAYTRGCFAGVSVLAHGDGKHVFTVAYHPKLAMAWSHIGRTSGSAPHTCAIVFAEGEERTELSRILASEWSGFSTVHPMFPALMCSLTLAHGLDSTLEEIKASVREVEARTGHHRFSSRHQTQPAAGELGSLSAQMSGCAAKLANGTRKMKVVEAINIFIAQRASREPVAPSTAKNHGDHHAAGPEPDHRRTADEPFLAAQLGLLAHRVQMQAVDTAYVQQRVQIQTAALFHLVAQQDNAIAFDTASATRSIAASSLQDSSSMKMLALVAMFFLPGSFVAALFSAPLFVWDDALASGGLGVSTRPQFALFWAVTAPLTALVFVMYGLWMYAQRAGLREEAGKTGEPQHQITRRVV